MYYHNWYCLKRWFTIANVVYSGEKLCYTLKNVCSIAKTIKR